MTHHRRHAHEVVGACGGRFALRRQGATHSLGTLAWLAGLLAVFVPLAVRAFRRA